MLTFGVNNDVYAVMPRVTKMNLNPTNPIEQEWLSEAYLKIVEGKKAKEYYSLGAYSRACDKNAILARKKKGEMPILSESETQMGYKGVNEFMLVNSDKDFFEKVELNADLNYYVAEFIDARDYIYKVAGKDIWWLLVQSRHYDKKAQIKLRTVIKEFYLEELMDFVILNPKCFGQLEDILGTEVIVGIDKVSEIN